MRNFAVIFTSYIFAFASLIASAEIESHETNNAPFRVSIPDGAYFYKSAPNSKNNEFSLLWIIDGGMIIDPAKMQGERVHQFAINSINGKTHDVFSGKTQMGSISKIELASNNLCGPAQFLPSIEAVGFYQGKVTQPFYMQKSKWGRQQRIFTSARIFAVPHSSDFASRIDYQVATEGERENIVDAIQKALVPDVLQIVSAQLIKNWGREYEIIGQGKSSLVFLEKVDIDNNGKPDFVGTYDVSSRYGDSDDYSVSSSILFVYLNGLELKQIAFSIGPDAFVLLGAIDVNLDGTSEIIYEERIDSSRDGGDPGMRIHLVHRDGNGWFDVYRSSSVCDSKLYNFND